MLEQNRKEIFGNALLLCIVCFLLFLTGCGCSRSEESNPAPNSGMMESESASETKNGKIDTTLPVDESERETNNSSETIQLEVEERERLGQYWVDINLPDDMEMEWEIQNLYYDIFIKKTDEEYPLIFDAATSSFGDAKEEDFYNIINDVNKQCIVITKDFITGGKVRRNDVDKLKCRVYRIQKAEGFNNSDLSTVRTLVEEIKTED